MLTHTELSVSKVIMELTLSYILLRLYEETGNATTLRIRCSFYVNIRSTLYDETLGNNGTKGNIFVRSSGSPHECKTRLNNVLFVS